MDKKMWITAVFILSWTNIKLTGELREMKTPE